MRLQKQCGMRAVVLGVLVVAIQLVGGATASAEGVQDVRAARWWLDRLVAEVGRFPEVSAKADPSLEALGVSSRMRRADLLVGVADSQARAGDRAGALRSLAACEEGMRKMPSPEQDAGGYVRLVEVYAGLGDMAGARRSEELALAACERFSKGDAKKGAESRESMERSVIQEFANAGAFDEALARVRRISRDSDKSYPLQLIAKAQAKAGLGEAARATIAEAEGVVRQALGGMKEEDRCYELGSYVDGLIETGDLERAERVAGELPVKHRVERYTTLAARHYEAKNIAASKRLAKASLDLLRELPAKDLAVKSEGPRLAGFLMFTGDKEAARQALALVKTGDGKLMDVQVYYGVALYYARNGEVVAAREQVDLARKAEAVERASQLGELSDLLSAMEPWPAKIAQAHVQAGNPEEALRLLELYKGDEVYGASLQTVVLVSKGAAGDLEGVKRGLEKIEPGMFSREIVRGAAIKAMVRRGDEKALRDLADWIGSLPDALVRISSYMVVCDELTAMSKGKR